MRPLPLRITVATAVVGAALMSTAVPASGAVVPPPPREHQIGKWIGRTWIRVLSLPTARNPLVGNGDHCLMIGKVLVPLTAPESGIVCTVPRGTRVFNFIWSSECSTVEAPPYFGRTKDELRSCAETTLTDPLDEMTFTIDGVALPNLSGYRGTSGLLNLDLPADNVLAPGQRTARSVGAGFGVMLRPLRSGTHTLTTCLRDPGIGPANGCHPVVVRVTA